MIHRLKKKLAAAAVVLGTLTTASHADPAVVPEALKALVEKEGWSQQWHDELYAHEDPAVGAAVRQLLRARRDAEALKSGLVVHEWGSMKHHVGTSTSEFDLISENQSDLPSFVKVRTSRPIIRPGIIEKPILYFYTQEPMKVDVTVRFPEGVLTQWYPDVSYFAPARDDRGRLPAEAPLPKNGVLVWNQIELNPKTNPGAFAKVADNHPWWHIARDTDATPVTMPLERIVGGHRTGGVERFLFYRGAGSYTPMVMPKREKPGEDLSVTVPFEQIDLRGVFLVRVNDSGAIITHAPVLRGQASLELAGPDNAKPIKEAAETAKAQLTDALEAAGLFPKEAAGLVKIWGDDMFTTPGERLIYIMPDNEAERLLPLSIRPAPSQTVRTLIGWVELSTPQAEKHIMDLVAKLGSADPTEAQAADAELRKLDRFAEAILQRVAGTTENAAVKQRIDQILAALALERSQGKAPKQR